MSPLDLEQIQGNVVPGFNKDHQAFVFVRFGDGEAGRAWLARLQPHVASAREVLSFKALFKSIRSRAPHPAELDGGALRHISATWFNVALTYAGLRVLFGRSDLGRLPRTFRQNRVPMAEAASGEIHALLIVAADQREDLEAELAQQREQFAGAGIVEVITLCGDTLPGDQRGHEHFGFKDGISQPWIAELDEGTGPPVAAGEFILGYTDQTGGVAGAGMPEWTRNGSFLAFLQLQQDVATFWSAMRDQARPPGVQPEDLASWIVGRKPDGALLSTPPSRISHIGRAYSRWLPASEALRHRILRRGIPYGSPLVADEPPAGHDRGILFLAYQADLERQFEHVWAQWLNSPSFPVPGAGKEALVGQSPPTGKRPAVASRWGQGGASVHLSLPTFVHPRLGAYFFAPGIDALVR